MRVQILSAGRTNVVNLGDKRAEVRRRFGPYVSFRRYEDGPESDAFDKCSLMVTYSPDDQVAMVEFAGSWEVVVKDVQLIGSSTSDITTALRGVGLDFVEDSLGGRIPDLGVEVYAPLDLVEGVQIGES